LVVTCGHWARETLRYVVRDEEFSIAPGQQREHLTARVAA